MHRFLIFTSLIFSAFALISVVWILVPAPSYYIWLYSVAVSEWSLWFGIIALFGIILALFDYAFYKNFGVAAFAVIIGAVACLISLYPLVSSIKLAREKNVSLSLTQYFAGLNKTKSAPQIKTEVYKSDGKTDLKMDVYFPPENAAGKNAGIIVIHGGSWNGGERSDFPQWNAWFTANGFTVFDIDYTLAPQPNYLTAIGDVKCAVVEIKKRRNEFKIDADKLILLGRSAGAQLALTAAYSANDARIPSGCADENIDETVRAVVSFYAPTDLLWAYDNQANPLVINGKLTLSNFLGGNPHESAEIQQRFNLTSPVVRVDSNSPPTLLIHGNHDQLVRKENLAFLAEKLTRNNIANETVVIDYAQHGFDYNFYGWGSQIAKPVILDFLLKNINVKPD